MISVLRLTFFAAAAAYIGIVLFMYVQQRSLQYFPSNSGLDPEAAGLTGVSEVTIVTPDGERIVAWYSPALAGQPTILFFHGNGGDLSDRAERLGFYKSRGFGALFVSDRGYGKSTGSISEKSFITDALSAHAWLVARDVEPKDIVVVGESLGTGVAVQLAAQRRIAALALEAPFTSAADVAAAIYWWLPVRLLMKDTFHSRDFIGKVKVPLLIQHGEADGVIPVEHGRNLFAMANEPKELVIIPGEGHDAIHSAAVWERESDFFLRALKPQN
jgi:uncharacterized protein